MISVKDKTQFTGRKHDFTEIIDNKGQNKNKSPMNI
jgi:hypothetical protein